MHLTQYHIFDRGMFIDLILALQWRHNERYSVSNHQPQDCLLNCLFRHRLKRTPKLRITGLCVGNSPVTGEFPAQRASNAENVSIWWRHHVICILQINCGDSIPMAVTNTMHTPPWQHFRTCDEKLVSFSIDDWFLFVLYVWFLLWLHWVRIKYVGHG